MLHRAVALIVCLVVLLGPASGWATNKESKCTRRTFLNAALLFAGSVIGSGTVGLFARRFFGPSQRKADRVLDAAWHESLAATSATRGSVMPGNQRNDLVSFASGVCVKVDGPGTAGSMSRRIVVFSTEALSHVPKGRKKLTRISRSWAQSEVDLSAQGKLIGWSEAHGIWRPYGASGITAYEVTDAGKAGFEHVALASCESGQGVTLISYDELPRRDVQFRQGSLVLLRHALKANQLGTGLFVAEPQWLGGAEGKCVGLVIDPKRGAALAGPAIEKLIARTVKETQRVPAGVIHERAGADPEGVPLPLSPLTAGFDTEHRHVANGKVHRADIESNGQTVITQVAKDGPAPMIVKPGMIVEQVLDVEQGWLSASDLALNAVLMGKGPGDVLELRVREPDSMAWKEIQIALRTERDLFGEIMTRAGFRLSHVRLPEPHGGQKFGLKANRDHRMPGGSGTWLERDDVIVAAQQWRPTVSFDVAKLLTEKFGTSNSPPLAFKQMLRDMPIAVREVTDLFGLLNGYGVSQPLLAAIEVIPRGHSRTAVRYLHPDATLKMSDQVNARVQR